MEDIAREATIAPWFQLYASSDRAFTKALVARARESGCSVFASRLIHPFAGNGTATLAWAFTCQRGSTTQFPGAESASGGGNPRAEGRSIYSPNLDPKLDWDYPGLASFCRWDARYC